MLLFLHHTLSYKHHQTLPNIDVMSYIFPKWWLARVQYLFQQRFWHPVWPHCKKKNNNKKKPFPTLYKFPVDTDMIIHVSVSRSSCCLYSHTTNNSWLSCFLWAPPYMTHVDMFWADQHSSSTLTDPVSDVSFSITMSLHFQCSNKLKTTLSTAVVLWFFVSCQSFVQWLSWFSCVP